MDQGEPEFAPLLDVTDLPIAVLREQAPPVLARILDDLQDPDGVCSAFASAIGD